MTRAMLASLTVALLLSMGCGGTSDSIPTSQSTLPKGGPSMTGSSPKPVEFNPPPR